MHIRYNMKSFRSVCILIKTNDCLWLLALLSLFLKQAQIYGEFTHFITQIRSF